MGFGDGLVKIKSAFILGFFDLFGEPAFLLEDARAKNRLARADAKRGDEVDDFHGQRLAHARTICKIFFAQIRKEKTAN